MGADPLDEEVSHRRGSRGRETPSAGGRCRGGHRGLHIAPSIGPVHAPLGDPVRRGRAACLPGPHEQAPGDAWQPMVTRSVGGVGGRGHRGKSGLPRPAHSWPWPKKKKKHSAHPAGLLVAAMQVWVTNVIGFGLLFWELDRGGPVPPPKLCRDELPAAAYWRFSEDENDDAIVEVAVGAKRQDRVHTPRKKKKKKKFHSVPNQLQRIQPDRHNAAHQPSEDSYGRGGHRGTDHLAARDCARGRNPRGS